MSKICYFYILQMKSSLGRIFTSLCHHIIYMCDFFREFRWLFCHDLHGFSRRLWFPAYMFPLCFHSYSTIANVLTLTATIEINSAWTKIMGYILFGAPRHATMNIQNLCFLSSYNKKNRCACPPGKSWRSSTFTRGVKKQLDFFFLDQNPKAFWREAPKPSRVCLFFGWIYKLMSLPYCLN